MHQIKRAIAKNKAKQVVQVQSPLAKHLDDGTLLCIVCESIVRSGAVWPVHLNSVRHKEKVAERKKMVATATTVLPPQSQPAPPESSLMQPPAKPPLKRPSTSSQLAQSDDSEPKPTPKKLKGILKNAPPLPPGFFDSTPSPVQVKNEEILDGDSHEEEEEMQSDTGSKVNGTVGCREEGLKAEEPGQNCQTRQNQTREADLPEGFFDDPVLDAKARNVEYKDPIQEEWDRFQKEIKEENSVSAQIIQDDTEVATVERQIIEVDEQLRNWSRVLDLEKKKEIVQSCAIKARDIKMETSCDSSDSDEDVDEFLDWRSKKSYK